MSEVEDDSTITGVPTDAPPPVITTELLAGVTDPAVIDDHLDRIAAALDRDDPAQAIGSAEELVESTAKLVLRPAEPALHRQRQPTRAGPAR